LVTAQCVIVIIADTIAFADVDPEAREVVVRSDGIQQRVTADQKWPRWLWTMSFPPR
jgi:hypothetical protein